jgi:hypothetical protein
MVPGTDEQIQECAYMKIATNKIEQKSLYEQKRCFDKKEN